MKTDSPLARLKGYLNSHNIDYSIIEHTPTYTAERTAEVAHVLPVEMAKTVMVDVDGRLAMAVVPASYHVDLALLRDAVGGSRVAIAVEEDFKDVFAECEVGAMPPFGNLYGIEVFVAKALTEDEEIVFNAGTHTELIRMKYRDFEMLVRPTVLTMAVA
jgi:Ala-tRNA(Pro) deacylase